MFVNHTEAVQYSNKLSAAIKKAGFETEIWGWDHSTGIAQVAKEHPQIANYPEYVIDNSPAVNTVAWHCYDFVGRSGLEQWKDLTDFHNAHPGVKQYMTECWTHLMKLPIVHIQESFFDLPDFMIGPLRNYAQGALAWVLGGSTAYDIAYKGGCPSCSGVIQVHKRWHSDYASSYEKTQDFYNMGQFSKYVKTGATYLSDAGTSSDIQTVQARNPNGDLVVVIANKLKDGQNIQINFKAAGTVSGYVPARSVTTWVLSSSESASQPRDDTKGQGTHSIIV
jgi:glucosylceramidase